MVATLNATGSLTTVIGTEVIVNKVYGTADIDKKWLAVYIDLTNMQAADTVEVRAYVKVQTGGTLNVMSLDVLSGVQTEPVYYLPSIPNDNGFQLTVKQTAGVVRTFYYRIYEI